MKSLISILATGYCDVKGIGRTYGTYYAREVIRLFSDLLETCIDLFGIIAPQ